MKIPLFQLVNLVIILIVFIFLVWYLWDIFFDKGYYPVEWAKAKKAGKISKKLLHLQKHYPDKVRFFNWWLQVERLKREKIPGAFAEVGVYKGESAAILHHMDPSRSFHLFDTFTGFPPHDLRDETGEAATYTPKNFADTSPEKVLEKIGGNRNITLHTGHFPETAAPLKDEIFSLVNLDVDLYNPTKAALEFFYTRLSSGGVIFIHDYNYKWEGIRKAIDEFVATIPEILIFMPDVDSTCLIVKAKPTS